MYPRHTCTKGKDSDVDKNDDTHLAKEIFFVEPGRLQFEPYGTLGHVANLFDEDDEVSFLFLRLMAEQAHMMPEDRGMEAAVRAVNKLSCR